MDRRSFWLASGFWALFFVWLNDSTNLRDVVMGLSHGGAMLFGHWIVSGEAWADFKKGK
jgi:hypothetical protein